MPDTITVLTENSMCFLASKKKIEFLRQIENGKEESELPPVKLLIRDRVSVKRYVLIIILMLFYFLFIFIMIDVFRMIKIKKTLTN